MTTYSKRRGRRSLAAILAAMLMASVLAVVAGSPAQAANTASEVLVDTDQDNVPDSREFAGTDRYDTALRLAKRFVSDRGGLASVDMVFVASGESLVDAVAVSGLAGDLDAPVLLTRSDELHPRVADFIGDQKIETVYVLGGPAAVADSVIEAIEQEQRDQKLTPNAPRISGPDRYATAAAIASKVVGPSTWCGGVDEAAVLVNGGDVSLAEAMLVGPLAARMRVPVLLTAADMLPEATADYLRSAKVERVVIVGGTDSVSAAVASEVSSGGADVVTRISGETAAATSVALAELALGDCRDALGSVSADTAALVHQDALPDGISSVPVLNGYGTDRALVPPLLVGDSLPASVRDYLAATPQKSGTNRVHYRLIAIGGTAAVSAEVMAAAVRAAATGDALSVAISSRSTINGGVPDPTTNPATVARDSDGNPDTPEPVLAGDLALKLTFSGDITGSTGDSGSSVTQRISDILHVNGAPAHVASATKAACSTPGVVHVTLGTALEANDSVVLRGGSMPGAGKDQRELTGDTVTVAAKPVDTVAPLLRAVLIAGQSSTTVFATNEAKALAAPTAGRGAATLVRGTSQYTLTPGENMLLSLASGSTTPVGTATELDAADRVWKSGDKVQLAANFAQDAAANKSGRVTLSGVRNPIASPSLRSVRLSAPVNTQRETIVPIAITGGNGTQATDAALDASPDIRLKAVPGGPADGAAGNAWTIVFDRHSAWKPTGKVDIDVSIADTRVVVRLVNGTPTFGDLKAALDGSSEFAEAFKVTIDSANPGICAPPNADKKLVVTDTGWARGTSLPAVPTDASSAYVTAGVTKVAIEAAFTSYVHTVSTTEMLDDIFARVFAREKITGDTAAARLGEIFVSGDTTLIGVGNGVLGTDVTGTSLSAADPKTTARYVLSTQDGLHLPRAGDLVVTLAGDNGTDTTDDFVAPATRTPPATAVTQVANSFAPDAASTTTKREDYNGGGRAFISGPSSTVKKPS